MATETIPTGESTDCTGVQLGNADVDHGTWTGTPTPERAPLPVYPQPGDLPPQPMVERTARQGIEL